MAIAGGHPVLTRSNPAVASISSTLAPTPSSMAIHNVLKH
jgi:hypothetical protein